MHHGRFSHHVFCLGTNPSPNTAVLNGKISPRHFYFFSLLTRSRAAWPQLSVNNDSKGMCSGQPPRSQSCWKVSPFFGEHTTNLCSGPRVAAECARNNQMKKEGKKTVVCCVNETQILNVWFLCHIFFKEQDDKWRQINNIWPGFLFHKENGGSIPPQLHHYSGIHPFLFFSFFIEPALPLSVPH